MKSPRATGLVRALLFAFSPALLAASFSWQVKVLKSVPGVKNPESALTLEFEAEDIFNKGKILVSGGKVGPQPMGGFGQGWSKNAQLFWGGGAPGAVLDLTIDVPGAATYLVELCMTRAPDYGNLRVEADGKASDVVFQGYGPGGGGAGPVQVGKFSLQAGQRKISFKIIGKAAASTGFAAGIDRVKLHAVGRP